MEFETEYLMWFVLSPLWGVFVNKVFSKQTVKKILIVSSSFFLIALCGYNFMFDSFHIFNLSFFIGVFLYMFRDIGEKFGQNLALSIVLTIGLTIWIGFYSFLSIFAGSTYVDAKYKVESYEVQYMRSQGFAGKPALYFRLVHTPFFGVIYKGLNTKCIIEDGQVTFPDYDIQVEKNEVLRNQSL